MAKNLLQKKISKRKIDNLLIFLQLYVRFADSGYNVKFEKVIEELTENKVTMGIRAMVIERAQKEGLQLGIEKGLKQGIEQGLEQGFEQGLERAKTQVVRNLLVIGNFTVAAIADIAGVSEDFVLKVKESLL